MGHDVGGGSPPGAGDDLDRRQASLLVSGLVLTPDSSLDAFRKRRAADPNLDLEHLRRAREILEQLCRAILSGEPACWQRVEEAWQALCAREPSPPTDADDSSISRPSPASGPARPEAPPSPPHLGGPPAPSSSSDPGAFPPMAPPPEAAHAPRRPAVHPAPVTGGAPSPPLGAVGPSASPAKGSSPWAAPQEAASAPGGADESNASTLSTVQDRPSDEALPFRKGEVKPPPPAAEQPPQKPTALGQTVDVGTVSPLAGLPLPFESGKAAPREAGGAAAEGGIPDAPTHLQGLTVDHYAALCAACAAQPDKSAEIQARYHIASDEQRAALDAHWRARMAADAQLEQHFQWHYARYEQWARQHPT